LITNALVDGENRDMRID